MARLITVLQAVSDASIEIGIRQTPLPQVFASQDADVIQLAALLSSVADDILLDEHYQDVLGDGCWIKTRDGAYTDQPKSDDDLILFDRRLAVTGLKYKFLQAKGLEYGEQMRDFTVRLNKLASRANNRVLDLDAEEGRVL